MVRRVMFPSTMHPIRIPQLPQGFGRRPFKWRIRTTLPKCPPRTMPISVKPTNCAKIFLIKPTSAASPDFQASAVDSPFYSSFHAR